MDKKSLALNIKNIIKQVIKENYETPDEPNPVESEQRIKDGLKALASEVKAEYGTSINQFANLTVSILSKYVDNNMNENNPAPAPKPSPAPGPGIAPGKPKEKEGPREPLFPPDDNPDTKPKAKLKESDIINKIEQRFNKLKHA